MLVPLLIHFGTKLLDLRQMLSIRQADASSSLKVTTHTQSTLNVVYKSDV